MNAPRSNMPPAARKQVAEANRLIAELNKTPAEAQAAAEAAAAAAPAEGAPPAPGEQEFPVVQIAAAPAPEPPAPAPAPAAPAPDAEDQKAQVRYRTLKGKYDAEVPMLLRQVNEQKQMIDKLLERHNAPAQPAAPARELSSEERFTQLGVSSKQVEEYGPELLDMISRVAQGSVTPEIRKLMEDTQEIKRTLAVTQKMASEDARSKVYTALSSWNPEWDVVNNDPEFLAWLEDTDVFSGSSRRAALASAFNTNDATRVVGIFRAFVGKTPVPAPTSAASVDRGTLVAPGRSRGGAMEAPDGSSNRILSEKEIGDFYTRVRKRQVSSKEYEARSAEIALAVAEGRVKPTHPDFHRNSA